MANKRKSFSENTNIALFNQVNGICPLCDIPLLYEKNGSKYKKYELAHIYPLNPKREEVNILEGVEKLGSDVDDDDNLIPLCKICHGKFDKPRTLEEYNNLLAIKKGLIAKTNQQEIWHQYQIEKDINKIISSLYDENINLDIDDIEYDPKEVDRKANVSLTNLTKRRIKSNVSDYYPFVKNKLSYVERENPGASDIICLQIKGFYLKQKQKESNQHVIYKNIVQWIQKQTNSPSEEAADIIASFFVQNCEIF